MLHHKVNITVKSVFIGIIFTTASFAQLDQVAKDKLENNPAVEEAKETIETVENPLATSEKDQQEAPATSETSQDTEPGSASTTDEVNNKAETTVSPAAKPTVKVRKKKPIVSAPAVRANPQNQEIVANQLRTAPEDASFLYETRYIPEYGSSEEFLPPDLEQEVIVETLERQTNRGFQIQLPNLVQTSVIAGIVFLFLLYKRNIKKSAKGRRYSAR